MRARRGFFPFVTLSWVLAECGSSGAPTNATPEVEAAIGADLIYLAVGPLPRVRVAAVSLVDGSVTWVTTLAESGSWGYAMGGTTTGVMVPFSDASGEPRFAFLAAADGAVMWSVQGHPYDVWGNAGEGVGVIDISEDEGGHVDLRDGTVLSMREINGNIVDGVLVAVEGALVLRSGDDLVGVVNGREAWRVTSSGRPKGSPAPGLHALGVIDSSGGSWRRAEFISYDTEQARALGEVPQDPDHDWEHFVVVDGNADTVTVYA